MRSARMSQAPASASSGLSDLLLLVDEGLRQVLGGTRFYPLLPQAIREGFEPLLPGRGRARTALSGG